MSECFVGENYPVIRGFECLSSCLASYFAYRKIPVIESDIFLCGGGYRISYSGDIYQIEIGAQAYQAVFRFLDDWHIKYVYAKMRGNVREDLCGILKRGKIVFARTGCQNLTYHNVFANAASPHWITVLGYSEMGVRIADNAIPDAKESTFQGEISWEEFLGAWELMDYEIMIIDKEVGQLEEKKKKVKEAAEKELESGIQKYFHPKQHWFTSKKEGMEAVPALLEDYIMHAPEGKTEALRLVQEMNYRVRIGGAVSYKKVLLQKLEEMQMAPWILEEYEDIITKWHNLFLHLLRAALKCDRNAVIQIQKRAWELIEREKKCAEFIMKEDGMKAGK